MLVAQQVFPQDHVLARKHHLGVVTRKFYFDPPRPFTFATLFLVARFIIFLLLGLSLLSYGFYLSAVTAVAHNFFHLWPWIFIGLALPASLELFVYVRGNRRLLSLNGVSCILALLIITLWRGVFFSLSPNADSLSFLLSGLFLLIVGLIVLGSALYSAPLSRWILICADGCIFVNKFQRSKVIRWDQITSVHMGKGFARIRCSNGTMLKLHTTWANSNTVQHLVYAKAFRYLLTRAKATYQAGEPVSFGRFTVSQHGIYNGKQLFPWAQLRSCEYIDSGLALISKDNSCLDLAYLSQLPNATVFMELINLILEGYSKTEQFSL